MAVAEYRRALRCRLAHRARREYIALALTVAGIGAKGEVAERHLLGVAEVGAPRLALGYHSRCCRSVAIAGLDRRGKEVHDVAGSVAETAAEVQVRGCAEGVAERDVGLCKHLRHGGALVIVLGKVIQVQQLDVDSHRRIELPVSRCP